MNGAAVTRAGQNALGWWVVGNVVGLWLAVVLVFPSLQLGALSYGRWVPVHLNVQLYGWTSLPLVAWLLWVYQADSRWGMAAVAGWSLALGMGVWSWLSGVSSGKIFLDWSGGALWAFVAAMVFLWVVLAAGWWENSAGWGLRKKRILWVALIGLAMVPVSLAVAASPSIYPPVDRTTGGPTGASLLGSTLFVVGLMLLLPRAFGLSGGGAGGRWVWGFFGISWLMFGVAEAVGGTHRDALQIVAMAFLLPWMVILPRDWSRFEWPAGSGAWRGAALGWWVFLVASGFLMYQPGWLDRLKFTQGLVAHSHLAMAGFTTSFCGLVLLLLDVKAVGGRWLVGLWHGAALVMVSALAYGGWREGADYSWMVEQPLWREAVMALRMTCGVVMTGCSVIWFSRSLRI